MTIGIITMGLSEPGLALEVEAAEGEVAEHVVGHGLGVVADDVCRPVVGRLGARARFIVMADFCVVGHQVGRQIVGAIAV